MTDRQPCRSCQAAGRDLTACDTQPKCLTHRGTRHRDTRHRDTWGACNDCLTELDTKLAALPGLVALAPWALEPARNGDATAGGVPSSRPPLDLNALDLAIGEWLLMTNEDTDGDPPWTGLESWEQDWRNVLHLSPYGPATEHRNTLGQPTLTGVVEFLRRNLPRAATTHPAIDQFAHDVRKMHDRAMAALHLHQPTAWTVPCPADHPHRDGECGHRLRVDHDGRELVMRCPRCGSTWTVERLLLVAQATGRGVWVTIPEAAERVGVHRSTIYRAVEAGRIATRYARVDLVSVTEWAATRRTCAR